ncbi:hypothetical protein I6A84_16425, partial [Frankia sp. CNm7]
MAGAIAFLLGFAVIPAAAQSTPVPSNSPAPTGSPAPPGGEVATVSPDGRARVHAVVLIDESSSETPADVAEEAGAAGIIASHGHLDPSSKVAVIGFGSDDGKAGQDPAIDRCPFAPVGSADFTTCQDEFHVRTVDEGSGTDHASALAKALSILESNHDPNYFDVIFLLTDGGVHVENSPKYGQNLTGERRTAEAKRQVLEEISPQLKDAGIQVWPLGFGDEVDVDWMGRLEKIGAGANPACAEVPVAAPSYRYAGTSGGVGASVTEALANATCGKFDGPITEQGQPGDTKSLFVDIPMTASTGTINAQKRDKNIKVQFKDPEGNLVQGDGEARGSVFKLATSGTSESLWIQDPLPGRWEVIFTWPQNSTPQTVDVTLIWQGELNTSIDLVPAAPSPGERATVRVSLLTSRNEPITDPTLLEGLAFRATLAGDGFRAVPVTLVDDGTSGDEKANDGRYAGQVTVPTNATGELRITGSVQAEGLRGTVQSATYGIPGSRSGGAILSLPPVDREYRGGTIDGSLQVDNPGAADLRIQLALEGGDGLSVDPATLSVPAGQNGFRQDLKISIPADAAYGDRDVVLRVLDVSSGGQGKVLAESRLIFELVAPPPWWKKYWYLFPLAVAVLAAAAAAVLVARRRARARADVQELTATLWHGGREVARLPAPSYWAPAFRFQVMAGQMGVTLAFANPGDVAYTVTRAKHAQLTVTSPRGISQTDDVGTRIPLPEGVELVLLDGRAPGVGPREPSSFPGGQPGHGPGPGGAPGPGGQEQFADMGAGTGWNGGGQGPAPDMGAGTGWSGSPGAGASAGWGGAPTAGAGAAGGWGGGGDAATS